MVAPNQKIEYIMHPEVHKLQQAVSNHSHTGKQACETPDEAFVNDY